MPDAPTAKQWKSKYWKSIYDHELERAADLRARRFSIIDGDGNDLVPGLIERHERNAQDALNALEFLERAPNVR